MSTTTEFDKIIARLMGGTPFPMSLRKGLTYATPATDRANGISGVSETLRGARKFIEEHGWTQGDLQGPNGGFCLMGSVIGHESTQFGGQGRNIPSEALQYLGQACSVAATDLDSWNDTPGRTKEEVLAALVEAERLAVADGK